MSGFHITIPLDEFNELMRENAKRLNLRLAPEACADTKAKQAGSRKRARTRRPNVSDSEKPGAPLGVSTRPDNSFNPANSHE